MKKLLSSGANDPVMLTKVFHLLSAISFRQKNLIQALEYLENGISLLLSFVLKHPIVPLTYLKIAGFQSKLRNFSDAKENFAKAIELYNQIYPPIHPELAIAYQCQGISLEYAGNYQEARSVFE